MSQEIEVAQTGDVPQGGAITVEVNGETVALFNVDGNFHAISDACTHVGVSLSKGTLKGTVVTCPLHAAEFDVVTGKALCPPADGNATSYKVRVAGSAIFIETE